MKISRKEYMRKYMREYYKNPENRAKQKEYQQTPEQKEIRRKRQAERMKDPKVKQYHLEYSREWRLNNERKNI